MDKLRTYRLIKQQFGFEKYLKVLSDRKLRMVLAAFRISAHKLQIERGRYSSQNLEDDFVVDVILLRTFVIV